MRLLNGAVGAVCVRARVCVCERELARGYVRIVVINFGI